MGGALDFASTEFATALGIPDLYMFDQVGKEISSGGGQMVFCRDVARVGQLVFNGGQWIDVDGAPYQLGSAEYYKQMLVSRQNRCVRLSNLVKHGRTNADARWQEPFELLRTTLGQSRRPSRVL